MHQIFDPTPVSNSVRLLKAKKTTKKKKKKKKKKKITMLIFIALIQPYQ